MYKLSTFGTKAKTIYEFQIVDNVGIPRDIIVTIHHNDSDISGWEVTEEIPVEVDENGECDNSTPTMIIPVCTDADDDHSAKEHHCDLSVLLIHIGRMIQANLPTYYHNIVQ